jgi:hypothetical protein
VYSLACRINKVNYLVGWVIQHLQLSIKIGIIHPLAAMAMAIVAIVAIVVTMFNPPPRRRRRRRQEKAGVVALPNLTVIIIGH